MYDLKIVGQSACEGQALLTVLHERSQMLVTCKRVSALKLGAKSGLISAKLQPGCQHDKATAVCDLWSPDVDVDYSSNSP